MRGFDRALRLSYSFAAIALLASTARAADHLLITEVVLTPQDGEYIEIYNPLSSSVDLSQYYISDFVGYERIPSGGVLPIASDFVAQFPVGASIAAGQAITIAFNGAGFVTTYGGSPTFEMPPSSSAVPDMITAYPNSIGAGRSLTDAGEGVELVFWDGFNDLVKDVDVIRVGVPTAANDIADKTGFVIDGPDPDSVQTSYFPDSMTMPVMSAAAGAGFSHKRLYIECGNETTVGGNGIGGHDETSENIAITWDGSGVAFTAPTPNTIGTLGAAPGNCLADIAPAPSGNDQVNVDDLLAVINSWGFCPPKGECSGDISPCGGNGQVNVDDLLLVINSWGLCP